MVLPLALLAASLLPSTSRAASFPRVVSDVSLGLSNSDIQTLNSSVDGRLQVGVPYARSCFETVEPGVGGTYDNSMCSEVQGGNHLPDYRLEYYGARVEIEWETCQATGAQCLLDSNNATDPAAFASPQVCSQGIISPLYVDVRSVDDVLNAMEMARERNLQISIKNTGHDLVGRSSAPGTLALWTHNLQNMTYVPEFVPTACPADTNPVPGLTIGAGVVFEDMYAFADSYNITVIGGAYPTVGASGGWIMGGGHSTLSNAYGLGVDRVLEFEVVTPTGEHLFVNECSNSDLFYALRGGGPGTFGVVMGLTYAALPQLTIQSYLATFDSKDPAVKQKFLEYYTENAVQFADAGYGGYINMVDVTTVALFNPLVDAPTSNRILGPLQQFITSELGGNWTFKTEPSYLDMYNDFVIKIAPPAGTASIVSSRLITDDAFATEDSRKQLADAHFRAINGSDSNLINLTAPYKWSKTNSGAGTSVTPAWRNAIWHLFVTTRWNFNETVADKKVLYTKSTENMDELRQLTPAGGAYVNEADVHEPNWQESFWGDNYNQLLALKEKYDPTHMLDCWHCIGFKGESDPMYSCYI